MKLLAVTVLVLAAGAAGWFIARRPEHAVSLGAPPRQVTATATVERTGQLPSGSSFEVWLVRKGRLVEALRTHPATPRVATAALNALLEGPTGSERSSGVTTQIPPGTRLLGISIARGVANVDLSSDYQNAAGSRALQLRLAQVVYTATQFPTVKSVRFSVDGAPVNVFSGSGLVLGHPVGRNAYRALAASAPLAGTWRALPGAEIPALTARASAWSGRELLLLGRTGGLDRPCRVRPRTRLLAPAACAARTLASPCVDRPRADRLGYSGLRLPLGAVDAPAPSFSDRSPRNPRLDRP